MTYSIKKLKQNILTRQKNFAIQTQFFKKYKDFFQTPIQSNNYDTAWLAYPILLKENLPFNRKDFQIFLENENIQTRVVFTGNIIRQPMMKDVKYKKIQNELTNSDNIMKRGVLLPVHHGMTNLMFEKLHLTIDNFINQYI